MSCFHTHENDLEVILSRRRRNNRVLTVTEMMHGVKIPQPFSRSANSKEMVAASLPQPVNRQPRFLPAALWRGNISLHVYLHLKLQHF